MSGAVRSEKNMIHTSKLIIRIQTVEKKIEDLDDVTKDIVSCQVRKECEEGGPRFFSHFPLLNEIVAAGVYDEARASGAVYFQAGDEEMGESEENGIRFKPARSEREIIEHFWDVASHYTEFVSFGGWRVDAPTIMLRSALYGIRASKDLMSARHLREQRFDALHVDLLDQFNFYGASEQPGGLHVWCKAFGIESPDEAAERDVDRAFEEKRYRDIAMRTARDLEAIHQLNANWNASLRF